MTTRNEKDMCTCDVLSLLASAAFTGYETFPRCKHAILGQPPDTREKIIRERKKDGVKKKRQSITSIDHYLKFTITRLKLACFHRVSLVLVGTEIDYLIT